VLYNITFPYIHYMAEAARSEGQAADFETAIAECGFGLFNVFIMICAVPCLSSIVFSATAMSYVMPTAECELKLSWLDKGMMNAVTYAGKKKVEGNCKCRKKILG